MNARCTVQALPLRRTMLVLGLLALLVGLVYANSLRNGFVYDDHILIAKNQLIKRLDALPTYFLTNWWAGAELALGRGSPEGEGTAPGDRRYRPLALATFAFNYALGGTTPAGYHVVNVLLHIGVTWLVYLLAVQLGWSPAGAAVAAALFGVHPLHTEAVNWVSARPELLMSVAVLASLWWASRGRLGLSLLAFACGLLSKEQAVVVPALVVLQDICGGGAAGARAPWSALFTFAVARYSGYVLVLLGYLSARLWILGGLTAHPYPFVMNPLDSLHGWLHALNALKMAGRYLLLSIWPSALLVDYSYDTIPLADSLKDPGVVWAGLAWGGCLALALWGFRGDRRLTVAIGLMALTFAPASNFLISVGTPVAERLFYLPSAGLCLLGGIAWERFAQWARRREGNVARSAKAPVPPMPWILGSALLLVIGLGLGARTVLRNQDWASDETLFRSATQVAPRNARAHLLLGSALRDKKPAGAYEEALQAYQTALRLYPDYARNDASFSVEMGLLDLKLKRSAEAIANFERAIELDPRWISPALNLGLARIQAGQYREAEQPLRRALALSPREPNVYSVLSFVLLNLARHREALAVADQAIELDPGTPTAHVTRAMALEGLGRSREAAVSYETALSLGPKLDDVRQRLQELRAGLGPGSEAAVPLSATCPFGTGGC